MPKVANDETAITVFDPSQYTILALDERATKRIQRMLAGITLNLLPKIKLTNAGQFVVPDPSRKSGFINVDGEDGIRVILLAVNMNYRSAFEGNYDPSTPRPPLCWSHTGQVGEGAFKGRACVTCPLYNTYADPEGRKGGCWRKGQGVALVPGQKLPYQIQIPNTGVKSFSQYLLAVGMEQDIFSVVTHLTVTMEGQHVRVKGQIAGAVPDEYQDFLAEHADTFYNLLVGPGAPADPLTQPSPDDAEEAAYRSARPDEYPEADAPDADEITI